MKLSVINMTECLSLAMEDSRSVIYRFHAGKAITLVLMFDCIKLLRGARTKKARANLYPHWPGSAEGTGVARGRNKMVS
jgi:hypothetical protein